METVSAESFFNGQLTVTQPADGYRYSIDAVLLAGRPRPKAGQTLIDLGTGCGIVALILAYRYPGLSVQAVEIQPELVRFARDNVRANGMQRQIDIIKEDMRRLDQAALGGPADWIVSNPPYHKPNSGRINPSSQKAMARHEINVDLNQVLATVRRLLRTGGRFCIVYPAERAADLIHGMRNAGIEPKWMQSVHSRVGQTAKLVLVEGIKGANAGIRIAAPMTIYSASGAYTRAVQRLMSP